MPAEAQHDLVCALQSGSEEAFAALLEQHKSAVYAIAFCTTGDRSVSEDVAQEAFLCAWKNRAELRDPGAFRSWVCGIARNLARNENRRRSRAAAALQRQEMHGDQTAPDPRDEVIERETEAVLWRALRDVPEKYREVLTLYYREGQSASQVALALGISETLVMQRLRRGRKHLEAQVQQVVERGLARLAPSAGFAPAVLGALASEGTAGAEAGTTAGAGASQASPPIHTMGQLPGWLAKAMLMKMKLGIVALLVALCATAGILWSQSSRETDDPVAAAPTPTTAPAAPEPGAGEPAAVAKAAAAPGATADAPSDTESDDGETCDKNCEWSLGMEHSSAAHWNALGPVLPRCVREFFPPAANVDDSNVELRFQFDGEAPGVVTEAGKPAPAGRLRGVSLAAPWADAALAEKFERCVLDGMGDVVFPAGSETLVARYLPREAVDQQDGSIATTIDPGLLESLPIHEGPSRGAEDAPVVIVVYTDFECLYCAKVLVTLDQLLEDYAGKVRLVKKLFPVKKKLHRLGAAAVAAGLQDRFWPMHDMIFAHQDQSNLGDSDLIAMAESLKLDVARFRADLDSEAVTELLQGDLDEGIALGLKATPSILIHDQLVIGARPVQTFRVIIDELLTGDE